MDPERLVGDLAGLVSLPEVVLRITALVDDPRTSAEDIGRAVQQDPALTARMLKVANGALFGLQRQVDTVARAVAVLGTRQVRDLAVGLAAARLRRHSQPPRLDGLLLASQTPAIVRC